MNIPQKKKKKTHGEMADNSSIQICINKVENRISFKIKIGHL